MSNEFKERIQSEQTCMKRISNKDLVCKDCFYRYDDTKKLGNTSTCDMYEDKPSNILMGGKCEYYVKG